MPTKIIKKGSILLARPSLNLDIFNRSVILITEHSDHGSVGFILNKEFDFTINKIIPIIQSQAIVKKGGPVETNNLFFIHKRPDLIQNSVKITSDLYWSGNIEDVESAVKNQLIQLNEINYYLGYCGWSPNQLAEEILNKEWEIVNDVSLDIFRKWDNDLWKIILNKLGGNNLVWLNTPSNPSMN